MVDETPLAYDLWVEEALSKVIRKALEFVISNGMPEGHHFYITFRTTDDAVQIPEVLLKQHPEELTVVLQHQFDNLNIEKQSFGVTLSFYGKPAHIIVPFSSIISFADPYVNFGLELKMTSLDAGGGSLDITDQEVSEKISDVEDQNQGNLVTEKKLGEIISLESFRKKT